MAESTPTALSQQGNNVADPLTDLLGDGARMLIAQAVEAELQVFMAQHHSRLADGRRALVRNGYLPGRTIQTGIGNVEVKVPKELVAVEDGFRESSDSWYELLVGLRARGLTKGPELAIGDGSLGFWNALARVYPNARHQRCWVHKTANVLNKMPKKLQPKAKADLHDIRTTNPIESAFATVRLRSKRSRNCGSRDTTLTMVFKLRCQINRCGWPPDDSVHQI